MYRIKNIWKLNRSNEYNETGTIWWIRKLNLVELKSVVTFSRCVGIYLPLRSPKAFLPTPLLGTWIPDEIPFATLTVMNNRWPQRSPLLLDITGDTWWHILAPKLACVRVLAQARSRFNRSPNRGRSVTGATEAVLLSSVLA